MNSNALKRVQKWQVKTEPERVCERLRALRAEMVKNTGLMQELLVEIETRVRQVLNEAGVVTILYPFYLNFGREVFARRLRFAGQSLLIEVDVLLEKWVRRSLDRQVLERIRDEVFTLTEPAE
ncbi:MAG: hypothetical protein N2248_05855 [candidate division WOR-3 bacterium]|uniref:Uncharacterized protein n=1 Tax=candidate division WOR-3 bacterium TaxID=2052148 RepID=A0A7C1N8Z2_UNCW3|nr:hypothetical protein [candidate division WOR-3 bacterium]